MLEGRREQFVARGRRRRGPVEVRRPPPVVDAAIDRWVWYAGWTDKIAQVVGGANPVAGPFFNLSTPEPTGVVAVLAPQESSFLGLVSVLAPVIATGNTAVVIAEREVPAPGALPGRGAGHLRPARRRGQRPLRPDRGDRRARSPRTRTSTRSTSPAPTTDWRRSWRSRRRTTSSASCVHSLWTTGRPTPARTA